MREPNTEPGRFDAITSAAFALRGRPGAYAVLLGSGVSTGAGVPTGWQIVERLIVELAAAQGEPRPHDPVEWFTTRYGQQPTYSGVVESLGLTEAERQALISRFIEGDGGARLPSMAHRSIARMAAGGWIRVILTTNFDRLMENALVELGVNATVLASPSAIAGAVPLEHAGVVVVKLHGDQRDPTIRNTDVELAFYPREVDALLDRVLDSYGLVVCGWSADHDAALRMAIQRAPNRRFTTFWASYGELQGLAKEVAASREAEVVEHVDADTFFGRLADATEGLAAAHRAEPRSVMTAVAVAKRELSGAHVAIPLHDTIRAELERVQNLPALAADGRSSGNDQMQVVVQAVAEAELLVSLVATAAYWGRADTDRWWIGEIARMANRPLITASVNVLDRPRLPALFMAWSAGTAAVAAGRDELLTELLSLDDVAEPGRSSAVPAVLAVSPEVLHVGEAVAILYRLLRPVFVDHLALGRAAYIDAWERWQYLLTIAAHDVRDRNNAWIPTRLGGIRVDGFRPVVPAPHTWALSQVRRLGRDHPLLRSGYFGGDLTAMVAALDDVATEIATHSERADRDILGRSGGAVALPSGLHYPGHYSHDPDDVFAS